jgi:hypothetical protein
VIRGLLGAYRPGDVAAVANLVKTWRNRVRAPSLELAADLATQRLLIGFHCHQEIGHLPDVNYVGGNQGSRNRAAKRFRSCKFWKPLRIPSTATSNKYQAGNRTPRLIRTSGIYLR